MYSDSCNFASRCVACGDYGIMSGLYCIARGFSCVSQSTWLFQTDPDPLVLTMISRPYINLALDSLMNEPRVHIVLQHPVTNDVVPPEVEATRRAGQEFFKNCIFPNKKVDCNKPKAGVYTKWRDIDVDANQIYGLPSQESLFNLLDYGQLNRGYIPRLTQMRGGCLFHAVHKRIKCPRGFTNTHLRRMLVLFMVENFEMLWPLLHICILITLAILDCQKRSFRPKWQMVPSLMLKEKPIQNQGHSLCMATCRVFSNQVSMGMNYVF